jgi:hypothetical protein
VVLGLWKPGGSELLMSKVFELMKVGGERVCEERPFILCCDADLSACA